MRRQEGGLSLPAPQRARGARARACGPWPREFFTDADEGVFNTFDFTIVVLSIAMRIADSSTSVVAVARPASGWRSTARSASR